MDSFKICVATMFLGLIMVVIFVGSMEISESAETLSQSEPTIVNIQSVDIQSERDGRFILGLGWEADEKAYYVYQITDDGGKKLTKYLAEDVTIYDNLDDGKQPYMDITDKHNIKMYLPKGTITEEYDVDIRKD